MKKFQIEVTEVLRRAVDVEARDEREAIAKVRLLHKNGHIVLDASDYSETEFIAKR